MKKINSEYHIYTFAELSEEAKQNAIQEHREAIQYQDFFWSDEALKAIQGGLEAFGHILSNRYNIDWSNPNQSYIPTGNPSGAEAEEVTGRRAAKWLINNASPGTFSERKTYKHPATGKTRRSRIMYSPSCCPFTGICYDESFLDEVRKFIRNPDSRNASEVLRDAAYNVNKDTESEIQYRESDAGIIEEIEANEYEYTEDGKLL